MSPPTASPKIVDALAANLTSVFASLCTERYGGAIHLARLNGPEQPPSTLNVRLDHVDLPPLHAHFTVRYVGGNMYDVQGVVENGSSRSFPYSLPESDSDTVPPAPLLTHAVATFLLDAIERRLGSDLLRGKFPEPTSPNQSRLPTASPS